MAHPSFQRCPSSRTLGEGRGVKTGKEQSKGKASESLSRESCLRLITPIPTSLLPTYDFSFSELAFPRPESLHPNGHRFPLTPY